MAKASPLIRSFNAGEFSDLMAGRVDVERYSASLKLMLNCIAATQGPAIGRSGTGFFGPVADETTKGALVPYVFNSEQALILEFSTTRVRFFGSTGLQVYAPLAATVVSASGAPIQLNIVGFGATVGDQVVLSGFPASYNLNGETANITNVAGNVYTLDTNFPALPVVNGVAARVYHVPCAYTVPQLEELRHETSVDVVYLMTTRRTRKLTRFGAYDWRLSDVMFEDGPYLPINETPTFFTINATGNAVPNMTSDTLPSGGCFSSGARGAVAGSSGSPVTFLNRQITYPLAATAAFHAFDADGSTYWAGNATQAGTLQYNPAAAFACDGYSIYLARDNQDPSYASKDYAPSSWAFEGFNGVSWVVLDTQEDYVLYDNNKSVFFTFANTTSFQAYRLRITKLFRNGLIEPRVQRLILRNASRPDITVTASGVAGINRDVGFLATDVGRLMRLKGSDGAWRWLTIQTRVSATVVTARLESEPFVDVDPIRQWRLGYWSDTTGWPTCAAFFDDRLWFGGSTEYPDVFAASFVGKYEYFAQTDTFGEVLDENAIVARLNARVLSGIRWIASDARGLLIGTGSEAWTVAAPDGSALTARNAKARAPSKRGSANVQPVQLDNQVLNVQRGGRAVRELAFVYEADTYKSPSMSQLASHLGVIPFVEMDYAAEPFSIVWVRRADGSVVGMTYNRDENVVGWHRHDFAGGVVEALAVIPEADELQDSLWMIVARQVDGVTRRYVEKLERAWDFDSVLADAHYVDCALRYDGVATDTIYGLAHLEGEEVYGLANGLPVGPLTVTNGSVEMPYPTTTAIIGLGFDSEGVLPRMEAGAEDGTAQGKVKRVTGVSVAMWNSFGGEIGIYNAETQTMVYETIEYPGRYDQFEDITLFTGVIGPITVAPGYDKEALIGFRRPKNSPLPFNVVALMPQVTTQDR